MRHAAPTLLILFLVACGEQGGGSDPRGLSFGSPASETAGAVAPGKLDDRAIEQIKTLEQRVTKALITADKETLLELLAPDFLEITLLGRSSRSRLLRELEAMEFEEGDDALLNLTVHQPAPGVVMLCYEAENEIIDENSDEVVDPLPNTICTSIWVNRGGKWLNVFYQATDPEPAMELE